VNGTVYPADVPLKIYETQGQKCVKYNGSLLWNRLPSSLKSYTSTTLYKRTLKLYL